MERALPLTMSVVIIAELTDLALGLPLARELAWISMILTILLTWPRFGLREYYLLSLSVVVLLLQFVIADDPWSVVSAAFDQASFLMSFLLLLGMLHEAASTSPAIAACGEYLTRQPAGKRYYALNCGTASLSVLFNIGVLSFLVVLIQRGIALATPNDARNPIRERRQISALLRGFAWCVIWSPTAVAPLAVAQLIPGTDRQLWMGYGLVIFAVILFVGAIEDRWRFRQYQPVAKIAVPRFPKQAVFRFFATCAWLFGMVALFVWLSGKTVIFGLLMACPLMLLGWLAVQYHAAGQGTVKPTMRRIKTLIVESMPKSAPVATTLATSGLIGIAAASLVPAVALAQFLRLDAVPDFVLLGVIPIALALFSLLALSPIMMAVFFGSLFGALPVLPADPTLIALSISCGWALSMTFSPFATVVLMISRIAYIPARRMTFQWNLAFTVLSAAILFPIFAILTGGQ